MDLFLIQLSAITSNNFSRNATGDPSTTHEFTTTSALPSVNTTAYNNNSVINRTGMLSVGRVLIFGYDFNLKLLYLVYSVLTAYQFPCAGITLVCSHRLASCICYVDALFKLSGVRFLGGTVLLQRINLHQKYFCQEPLAFHSNYFPKSK